MKRLSLLALTGTIALLSACGSSAAAGGGGTYSPSDAASSTDTGSSTGAGNNTKNTSAISTKTDTNAAAEIKVDKAASAEDATKASGAKMGAANAGKVLYLYLSDAAGNVLSIIIDTDQNPLPKSGIKVGAVNGGAWMTYVGVSGGMPVVMNSTANTTGTIDINACPDKSGIATVGKLNNVMLEAPDMGTAMAGMKTMTFNGSFNLVYFGTAGELMCTIAPPVTADAGSTGTDAGTTTGGSSCSFGECDQGTNKTRNCCPYAPCLGTCYSDCAQKAAPCAMECAMGADPAGCQTKCVAEIFVCFEACWTSCNVSAECKAKLKALDACDKANQEGCDGEQSCLEQKCCAEAKAAF